MTIAIKTTMLQMRDIGCDWINRAEQHKDYEQKKKVLVQVNRDFPRRATAPTLTQIILIRRMMHSIFDPKAPGMKGGVFTKKDLKQENVDIWKAFYNESFFFKYLLDYSATIRQITDLSHLWYREFFLEITKCVQFPIGMSMPWVMTEYLVNTPAMKENIFFPLDIYNDAAARALT
jgi:cytoplasmic FMR1 interacting protein